MELKYLIVLLCIELTLAHRYFNLDSYEEYIDEDYSDELTEPPKPIRKLKDPIKNPVEQNRKSVIKNVNSENRNVKKVISQYEVTENVIDVPNDNTENGRINSRFMLNKPLNQVNNKPNTATVNLENKGTSYRENDLKRLEKEYLSIVKLLEDNRNRGKIIDFTTISNKVTNFWNDVKITLRNMAEDIENGASILHKLQESGKNVVAKVGSFFGRK